MAQEADPGVLATTPALSSFPSIPTNLGLQEAASGVAMRRHGARAINPVGVTPCLRSNLVRNSVPSIEPDFKLAASGAEMGVGKRHLLDGAR